jgi:hypothetical protein
MEGAKIEENSVCLCIDFAVGFTSSKCIEVVIDVVVGTGLVSLGWATESRPKVALRLSVVSQREEFRIRIRENIDYPLGGN